MEYAKENNLSYEEKEINREQNIESKLKKSESFLTRQKEIAMQARLKRQ